jgi:hypothetical protein
MKRQDGLCGHIKSAAAGRAALDSGREAVYSKKNKGKGFGYL